MTTPRQHHHEPPTWFGYLVGIAFMLAGALILVWNENHFRRMTAFVDRARVVMVKVYGRAVPGDDVYDPLYGVGGRYLAVHREVQYFQWDEIKGTETYIDDDGDKQERVTYSYRCDWYGSPIDSREFHHKHGHTNSVRLTLPDTTFYSRGARINDYLFPPALIDSVKHLPQDSVVLDTESAVFRRGIALTTLTGQSKARPYNEGGLRGEAARIPWCLDDNCVYYGDNPLSPEVGDVRVVFRLKPATVLHVFAQPTGEPMNVPDSVYPKIARISGIVGGPILKSLKPFTMEGMSRKMVRVSTEPVDGAKVLYNEASFNNMLRWAMRFVGWLLMVIACKSMLGAIVAMADGFSLLRTLVPDWRLYVNAVAE